MEVVFGPNMRGLVGKTKTKEEEKEKEGGMGKTGEWKNPKKTSEKVSTVKRGDGNGDTDLLRGRREGGHAVVKKSMS